MKFTADYSLKLQDGTGRVFDLSINGACIDEAIKAGATKNEAREGVESNAFWNAVYEGLIGEDAWITA